MGKKKRDKANGALNDAQTMAPHDERGKKHSIDKPGPKAPDGVSGDWR